jgi:putative ABC transport system substrate-binding protein
VTFAVTRLATAVVLLLFAAPLAAQAQQAGKIYRIGMLETAPMARNVANLDAFRQGLRELGYIEGRNFVIEYRSDDGRNERAPDLATELIRLKVDVIVTRGTPAVLAAKNATTTIPIVMTASGDPVGTGAVASLSRPGGNVTGLSAFSELAAKRFELLREMVPQASRILALLDMSDPVVPLGWKRLETAARSRGVQAQLFDVRTPEDLSRAFDSAISQRADALVVGSTSLARANRRAIADLAAKHRLPAIYGSREFVDAGGLIAYGVSYPDLYRRAARFVAKIFSGANPGDLPVEQPTKFELVVNRKTAKALGMTIPPSLLLRTDQVID